MKRYTIYIISLLLLCVSCYDEQYDGNDGWAKSEIIVNLNLPDEAIVQTRAEEEGSDDERTLKSLFFVTYNGNNYSETIPCNEITETGTVIPADGKKAITLRLHKPATRIYAFANVEGGVLNGNDNVNNLILTQEIAGNKIPMSGVADIQNNAADITLQRSVAKVTLQVAENTSSSFFSIQQVHLYNAASKGYAIGKAESEGSEGTGGSGGAGVFNPFSGDNVYIGETKVSSTSPYTLYCYETQQEKARLIVEASYQGSIYFYPIDFRKNGTSLDLVRNHHYKVTVTQVEGIGYASLDDAKSKDAINIVADIYDSNYAIKDMVVYGGHELGVCDEIQLDVNGKGTAQIFTTYPPEKETLTYQWEGSTFVTGNGTGSLSDPTEITMQNGKKGYLYTWNIDTHSETNSTETKEDKLTFKVGLLSLTVDVKQVGKPLSDLDLNVRLYNVYNNTNTELSRAYFKSLQWRTNKTDNLMHIYGTLPQDMQGISRVGLHFNVGVNPFAYRISKDGLAGRPTAGDGSKVSVSEEGNDYVIRCNTQEDTSLWETTVTINKAGNRIVLPVYHRGIIHEIKDRFVSVSPMDYPRHASQYVCVPLLYAQIVPEDGGEARMGWFYYEMIDVEGALGDAVLYVYDRNIGAKTNGMYSDINSSVYGDPDARGAYYMRDIYYDGGTRRIHRGPSPRIEAQNWEGSVLTSAYSRTMSMANNEYLKLFHFDTYSAYFETPRTKRKVYFPLCRYIKGATYEVTERKGNQVHRGKLQGISAGYYWSSTGCQDNADAPEEYDYYQLSNNGSMFSKIRFSDATGGDYDATFRGMQVRCVFQKSKTAQ